jgi:hypothetical protein
MIAFPSNGVFDVALRTNNRERIQKWLREEPMLDGEDYRTVNTDRGPVRGYGSSMSRR